MTLTLTNPTPDPDPDPDPTPNSDPTPNPTPNPTLRTLSSQIYSATARVVYELIQNADDCSFAEGGPLPSLHLECSDEALVCYHNELGFQPRDLYAMCQVG